MNFTPIIKEVARSQRCAARAGRGDGQRGVRCIARRRRQRHPAWRLVAGNAGSRAKRPTNWLRLWRRCRPVWRFQVDAGGAPVAVLPPATTARGNCPTSRRCWRGRWRSAARGRCCMACVRIPPARRPLSCFRRWALLRKAGLKQSMRSHRAVFAFAPIDRPAPKARRVAGQPLAHWRAVHAPHRRKAAATGDRPADRVVALTHGDYIERMAAHLASSPGREAWCFAVARASRCYTQRTVPVQIFRNGETLMREWPGVAGTICPKLAISRPRSPISSPSSHGSARCRRGSTGWHGKCTQQRMNKPSFHRKSRQSSSSALVRATLNYFTLKAARPLAAADVPD